MPAVPEIETGGVLASSTSSPITVLTKNTTMSIALVAIVIAVVWFIADRTNYAHVTLSSIQLSQSKFEAKIDTFATRKDLEEVKAQVSRFATKDDVELIVQAKFSEIMKDMYKQRIEDRRWIETLLMKNSKDK